MATRADRVVLDMDSSESPVHGAQEGSAYNGHFESVCYYPLFLFTEHGDCLGATLRPGNVHSAEDWDNLLLPEIDRQQAEGKRVAFRADAAFAKSEIYAGISDLLAPNGPFIHPRAAERTKFCSSPNRPAPEAVTAARSDVEATGAAAFRAFLRHRSTRVPLLRHAGFVALSPRVSLPARVVPRSSAACRRTAAWSDALLPGGASSTGRASRAGPRSSPAAAGDS